jgi:hypothetical protein
MQKPLSLTLVAPIPPNCTAQHLQNLQVEMTSNTVQTVRHYRAPSSRYKKYPGNVLTAPRMEMEMRSVTAVRKIGMRIIAALLELYPCDLRSAIIVTKLLKNVNISVLLIYILMNFLKRWWVWNGVHSAS